MVTILDKMPDGSKLIPGTEVYYINQDGVVTKLTKKGFKLVKLLTHNTGWLYVNIYNRKQKRQVGFLHKILAEMYIPNPNKYKYVKMKDGDRKNVKVSNLEWCTYHNVLESTRKNKYTNPNPKALLKLSNNQIIKLIKEIVVSPNEPYVWRNLANKYNISTALLHRIRNKGCYREYWEKYDSVNYEYKSRYSARFNKNDALKIIRDIVSYDKITHEDINYLCDKYNITKARLWNIRKQIIYKDVWKRDEFKNYKYKTIFGKDGK